MKIVTVVKDAAYRENLEKLLRKLGQEYKSVETASGGQEGYISERTYPVPYQRPAPGGSGARGGPGAAVHGQAEAQCL